MSKKDSTVLNETKLNRAKLWQIDRIIHFE